MTITIKMLLSLVLMTLFMPNLSTQEGYCEDTMVNESDMHNDQNNRVRQNWTLTISKLNINIYIK